MKRALVVLGVVLTLALATAAMDFYAFLSRPLSTAATSIDYEIAPGTPFRGVIAGLAQRGLVERRLYWRLLARLDEDASDIKAGLYELEPDLTPPELLQRLVAGRTKPFKLTLPEGWTFAQFLAAVHAHDEIEATLGSGERAGARLMAALDDPGASPEGWFYPDTYQFPRGTTDVELLRRSHAAMERKLEDAWARRAQGLPLASPYEALILASIVEKETAVAAERARIAAVFVERLRRGMRLQTDPTVIYGLAQDYDGNLRRADLRRDTPYNTYLHAGLPPTPIAMPGGAAIEAVLDPADSQALFFVAKGDGTHYFSKSYEQHRKAVIKYQLNGD